MHFCHIGRIAIGARAIARMRLTPQLTKIGLARFYTSTAVRKDESEGAKPPAPQTRPEMSEEERKVRFSRTLRSSADAKS